MNKFIDLLDPELREKFRRIADSEDNLDACNLRQFYWILCDHKEFISENSFNACIADLKDWLRRHE